MDVSEKVRRGGKASPGLSYFSRRIFPIGDLRRLGGNFIIGINGFSIPMGYCRAGERPDVHTGIAKFAASFGLRRCCRRRFRACPLGGGGRGRQTPLPDRRRAACSHAGDRAIEPGRASARVHPGASGTRLQGEAGRPHRGFAGRTGWTRARPAERGRIHSIHKAQRRLSRTNSASPSLSACAGTRGISILRQFAAAARQ